MNASRYLPRPESLLKRIVVIIGFCIFYIISFRPVFNFSGGVTASLVTIPVVASGWYFGPIPGLIAGLIATALNAFLFFSADGMTGLSLFMTGWPGHLLVIAAGYSMGLLAEEVLQRTQIGSELKSRERFISLISIAVKSVLDPREDEKKYYYLANHLANLFVADHAYILNWDASQNKMSLLTSTKPLEQIITNIVLAPETVYPGAHLLTGRQALVVDRKQNSPYVVDLSVISGLSTSENSEFVIPLIAGEYKFGAVVCGFSSEHFFSREDLLYAQLVASQISLALWTSEQDTKIKQQLAEANSLRLITNALSEMEQIGLETVLKYIVDSARDLIPSAEQVTLHMIDNEKQILVPRAISGQRNPFAHQLNIRIGQGVAGRVVETRQTLNVPMIKEDPLFFLPQQQSVAYQSLMTAPIQSNNRCVGTISVDSQNPNAFNADDCRLLEILGTQAAIAIDNASLIEKNTEDLREINSLYQITQGLALTLDPEQLMRDITDLLEKNFGYYHVRVFVLEPENNALVMRYASGKNAERILAQDYRLAIGEGIVGHVAELGESFVTNNVEDVVFFKRDPLLPNTHSELCVPIKVNDQIVGVLDIQDVPPRLLTQRQLKLMMAIADQLAVALQKAGLYKDLQNALVKEKETRAQLIQVERLSVVGRLLASVSHELNNPIQAIQNALYLLKTEERLSTQGKQDLDIILSETERMASLLNRLRNTYRNNNQKDDFAVLQVNAIVEDVFALTSTFMRQKGIIFNFQPYLELPPALGVEEQIRQVILNILMNSIDAMPNGGQLTTITDYITQNNSILIEFCDTGPGIDDQIFSRIFDPFITSKEAGTGLGLTISQEIINRHGGRIEARNNPDGGAIFSIWLPVGEDALL